jgi:copper chaperone CopZ
MKKVYKLENLGCAGCAAKMEDKIRRLNGVKDVSINFITQKLTIEASEELFDEAVSNAEKICRRIEPDCRVLIKK